MITLNVNQYCIEFRFDWHLIKYPGNVIYFSILNIIWLVNPCGIFTKFNLTILFVLNYNYLHKIRNCISLRKKLITDTTYIKLWQNVRTFFYANRIKEISSKRKRPQLITFRSLINFWKNKIFNFMVTVKLILKHDYCEINYI